YFDVVIDQPIVGLSGQLIFGLCPNGVTGVTCQFIHRAPASPEDIARNLPGPIVVVDQTLLNIGTFNVGGIDVNAQYKLPTPDWGLFTLNFQGSYVIK